MASSAIPFKPGEFEINGKRVQFEQNKAAVGPPGLLHSNLVCPLCDIPRILKSEPPIEEHCLSCRPGSQQYVCSAGHEWNDLTSIQKAGGRQVERKFIPIKRPPSADGPTVPMSFQVPAETVARLQARFPANLTESVVSILRAMCEEGAFVVPAQDAFIINQRSGEKIASQMALIGWVTAIVEERNKMKEEVEELRKAGPAAAKPTGATFGVELSAGIVEQLAAKARMTEQPLGQYLENVLQFAMQNNWF